MKKLKGIDGKLDEAWSKLVKLKAGWKCIYCGKESYVQAHHIYSRSNRSVRWDIENGASLCAGHHTLSSGFSAHKTPLEFAEWIKERNDEEWYNSLRLKANSVKKWTKHEKEEHLKEMLKQIKELED